MHCFSFRAINQEHLMKDLLWLRYCCCINTVHLDLMSICLFDCLIPTIHLNRLYSYVYFRTDKILSFFLIFLWDIILRLLIPQDVQYQQQQHCSHCFMLLLAIVTANLSIPISFCCHFPRNHVLSFHLAWRENLSHFFCYFTNTHDIYPHSQSSSPHSHASNQKYSWENKELMK